MAREEGMAAAGELEAGGAAGVAAGAVAGATDAADGVGAGAAPGRTVDATCAAAADAAPVPAPSAADANDPALSGCDATARVNVGAYPECEQENPVLRVIEQRSSTRAFAKGEDGRPVQPTLDQRRAVLHAASRAASAGAMMMYSVIDIREQATLERLAELCDHQPMIAHAPWALVFVVDYAKWIDLFEFTGCYELEFVERTGKAPNRHVGLGEWAIASQDAVIAAQTAVIAAEAVGLGSCYVGDVVENAEQVAELLDLPAHTVPLCMLILGQPARERAPIAHPVENLVMRERYRRASPDVLAAQAAEMDEVFRSRPVELGERVRDIYTRKHTSDFMAEMGRSMELWLQNWRGAGPLAGRVAERE